MHVLARLHGIRPFKSTHTYHHSTSFCCFFLPTKTVSIGYWWDMDSRMVLKKKVWYIHIYTFHFCFYNTVPCMLCCVFFSLRWFHWWRWGHWTIWYEFQCLVFSMGLRFFFVSFLLISFFSHFVWGVGVCFFCPGICGHSHNKYVLLPHDPKKTPHFVFICLLFCVDVTHTSCIRFCCWTNKFSCLLLIYICYDWMDTSTCCSLVCVFLCFYNFHYILIEI